MDQITWSTIASIIASVLTLVGVIVTVEHGNKIRDVQMVNQINDIRKDMTYAITNLEKSIKSLENRQESYNILNDKFQRLDMNIELFSQRLEGLEKEFIDLKNRDKK